jgi:anaerobic selenocysteine-containing dehydrogenase
MGLTRREFIRASGGVAASLAAPTWLACATDGGPDAALPGPTAGPIDYRNAVAKPTICFGCTTHCGVIGWVQDGRVRLIEGNPKDPNSQGTICSKANGLIEATENPERLLYPLRRIGPRGSGDWERISWDEALDEVASRLRALREAGTPEQFVFHYGRDKTKGFSKRFTDAYGTPNRLNRRSICSSNRRAPLMSFYGREFEWESQDLEHTKMVLNFGGNPMEAYQGGLYMRKRLMDARVDRGARLVTFDVRPSATASSSDEYFPVAPASDGAIARTRRSGGAGATFPSRIFRACSRPTPRSSPRSRAACPPPTSGASRGSSHTRRPRVARSRIAARPSTTTACRPIARFECSTCWSATSESPGASVSPPCECGRTATARRGSR